MEALVVREIQIKSDARVVSWGSRLAPMVGWGRARGVGVRPGVPFRLWLGTLTRLPERLSPSGAPRDPAWPLIFIRPES